VAPLFSRPTHVVGEVFALLYRAAPGFEAHLWPHATLALSGDTGAFWLNSVVVGDDPAADAMRSAVAVLRERALPGWVFHPDALTPRLAPLAQEFGLNDAGTVPFMVLRPEHDTSPIASDLTIERVRDETGLREFNRITAAAFETRREAIDRVWGPALLEMPGLKICLGRRDGEAITSVMTVNHGSVVGIWTMGTLPERQRTGAGRRLLTAVLADHRRRGATAFYLVASEAGQALYEQLGFLPELDLRIWIAAAPAVP
jgi:GNAT superfamily N-acetyltransferase